MSVLNVVGLRHSFAGAPVLKDISFQVQKGEIVGLIGPSGAGKSTLLRALCGLEKPDSGEIILQNQDITSLSERNLRKARQGIGLVFQHFNLLETRTVTQNVALPLKIAGWPAQKRQARVAELLALVGLSEHHAKYPAQLSGGQKQRVGIARALANDPSLLLCDEATSALDPQSTTTVLDLLSDINRTLGLTIILITHEMEVIRRFAQRVLVLEQGALVHDGGMLDLLTRAHNPPAIQALLNETRPTLPSPLQQSLTPQPQADRHAVIRVVLVESAAQTAFLSELSERFSIKAVLIAGGASLCAGVPTVDMILALNRALTDDIVEYLAEKAQLMEVLGYVPAHR
ncbi:methionine ABC transporter ATP-binding protein [Neokomagataea thailandica]|uniref:D-methionine transporter ATP-binding protein n=1 Tax=Neokomagataea tanensis NBRC 106556 TaxID=1223519 RepID=A0ABQ0QK14_9PROT|nr:MULTISPECIES: ATP-binding cassette domain-containing protein [Neokomagataea]GBR47591.1 D-methionine transporter ATP-binding protein [Neokomagataea tanensis NBRC 106556]